MYIDPSGHKQIVSNIKIDQYVKEYGYGPTGKGYRKKYLSANVEKHEFTNSNIVVYKSGEIQTESGDTLTGFHKNASAASKGEFSVTYNEDGNFKSIEDLILLDKEYGKKIFGQVLRQD